MKYLFWRGRSLWCRFPFPDKPERYPLGIKRTSDSKTEFNRCLAEGERVIAALRTRKAEDRFFENQKPIEAPRIYNPKFWRIAGRYWVNELQHTPTGKDMRYHLLAAVRHFGLKYAKDIKRSDIENWRNNLKKSGVAVNTINNYFTYFKASYRHANEEEDERFHLNYNPADGMKKMEGGKVRRFLLTVDRFERNYKFFQEHSPLFAFFYLGMWELGSRPVEASLYSWEMVEWRDVDEDGTKVPFFIVPGEIVKMKDDREVAISNRLWRAMQALGYRHGLVFRNDRGEQWKHWEYHMDKLKAAYPDAGWLRDTRRGFVTRKCELEGHDQYHVMMQTGHKTRSVFDRYRIGNSRHQAAVVNDLAEQKGTNFAQLGVEG